MSDTPLSRPPIPHLVDEIHEAIIDHVANAEDRRRSLRACACTCRAWLSRSHQRLFTDVLLNDKNWSRFLTSIRSNPTNGRYINTLRAHSDYDEPWFHVAILLLSHLSHQRYFPNLLNLTILGFDFSMRTHPSMFVALSQFRTVRCLRLLDLRFASFRQFTRLLLALPGITELEIELVEWDDVPGEIITAIPRTVCGSSWKKISSLSHLYISDSPDHPVVRDFMGWLSYSDTSSSSSSSLVSISSSLSHLELHLNHPPREDEEMAFSRLLLSCGSSIVSINIELLYQESPNHHFIGQIKLSHNPSLRILSLSHLSLQDIQFLPSLLTHIASNQIKEIHLQIDVIEDRYTQIAEYFLPIIWNSIDGILSQNRFAGLDVFGCSFFFARADASLKEGLVSMMEGEEGGAFKLLLPELCRRRIFRYNMQFSV